MNFRVGIRCRLEVWCLCTDTARYRVNIRKVEAVPIKTAGGIVWLDRMCDLCMPGIKITGGYINDHIEITLISESVLTDRFSWTFFLSKEGKLITHQTANGPAKFWAKRLGNLFYLPLEVALLSKDNRLQGELAALTNINPTAGCSKLKPNEPPCRVDPISGDTKNAGPPMGIRELSGASTEVLQPRGLLNQEDTDEEQLYDPYLTDEETAEAVPCDRDELFARAIVCNSGGRLD